MMIDIRIRVMIDIRIRVMMITKDDDNKGRVINKMMIRIKEG